ncbi:hypothetical protein ACTXT7_015920 [Hymenolepis weldensis]
MADEEAKVGQNKKGPHGLISTNGSVTLKLEETPQNNIESLIESGIHFYNQKNLNEGRFRACNSTSTSISLTSLDN